MASSAATASPTPTAATATVTAALTDAKTTTTTATVAPTSGSRTSDPCPLTQGKVLVWRDEDHLSETFTRRLEPSLGALLLEELRAAPLARR